MENTAISLLVVILPVIEDKVVTNESFSPLPSTLDTPTPL